MREMFNHGDYWARVKKGEYKEFTVKDRHPSPPLAPVPHCTRSQLLAYIDLEGQEVARVHQYLLPNGSIGTSGMPDPKRLFHDGILYRLKKRDPDTK